MLQPTLFKESTRGGFLLIMLLALSACDSSQKYIVRSLPAGENREIVILADEMAEISRLVYYKIKVGGETVVPLSHICYDNEPETLTFKTVSASGGNLVGVYEVTRPDRLIVLHDFSSGITWPGRMPQDSDWEASGRGTQLMEQFERDHPDSKFTLKAWEACGIRQ